jgi:hypothetical protein
MLDRGLTELYGAETGLLKRAARRNRERFPPVRARKNPRYDQAMDLGHLSFSRTMPVGRDSRASGGHAFRQVSLQIQEKGLEGSRTALKLPSGLNGKAVIKIII